MAEQCDVLILSASYGGGHNQVARALTQALQLQEPDIRILTVDYCDLLFPFITRLTQFGYMQSIKHFPVGYALYYQATGKIASDSFWQRRLNRMGYSELILLVNRLKPRIIVSTFPLPAGVLSEMKECGELNVPLVTVITDYSVHSQWIHPYTDLFLVGSAEVANGLAERGINPGKIAVTGIPILPAFCSKYYPGEVKREYGFEPDDQLLLFMGGNDGMFGNFRFRTIMKDLPSTAKALIIAGSNQELYDKLLTTTNKNNNIKVVKYVQDIAAVMSASDVLITKAGGITVSEALAKALPMIIYKPNPGQEEVNANYLWRHHAAIIAGGERRLKTAIQRIVIDHNFQLRLQRHCGKIGKPDAALVSAFMILRMIRPNVKPVGFYQKSLRREIRA